MPHNPPRKPKAAKAGRRAVFSLATAVAWAAAMFGAALAAEPENPKPVGNLVQNPGFEAGLAHWTVEPAGGPSPVGPAVDPGVSRTGKGASLKLAAQPGKQAFVRQIGIPCDSRVKRYRFSVWTRARGVPADWMARFGIQGTRDGHAWSTFQNRHVSCAVVRNWGRTVIEFEPPAARGFFCARATLQENGRPMAEAAAGFCVIEPVQETDPFFGMDPNGQTPDLLEALHWIGVGSLGIHASWTVPKEELGNVRGYMQTQIKKQLGPYLQSDFDLVGYLKIDPGFALEWVRRETLARRRQGLFPYPDALFTLIGDVAEAEGRAMKDRVRTWIIQEEIDAWVSNPNAPAGSGTCELARHVLMTRMAYDRLKKVDPGFVVAGLSVCGDYRGDPPYPLVRRVLPELRGHLDLLAPDMYCGAYDFTRDIVAGPEAGRLRQALLDTRRVQADAGLGRELIVAEKGLGVAYHAPPDDLTNQAMADFTARNLIVARSAWPVRFYSHYLSAGSALWHIQSRGYPSDDDHPVTDFGLWKRTMDPQRRQQYQPRPAVAAYATVARLLAGTDDPAELPIRDELFCDLFNKKGRTVAALWTTAGGDRPLRIAMPAASELCDLMGNVRALPAGDVVITASESPVFLVLPANRRAVAAATEGRKP